MKRLVDMESSVPESRSDRGMSLLEVAIAFLLATIVFLAIARVMALGVSSTTNSKVQTSTVTLAQQGIETVQGLSFSSIVAPSSPEYFDQFGNIANPVTGNPYTSSDAAVRYIRTTTVTSLSGREKEITISVRAVRRPYGRASDVTSFTTRRVDY